MGCKILLPMALAAVLLAPGAVFADRKDGEKQRRERSGPEYRDAERRARDGYYEGDRGRGYPEAYGQAGEYGRDKDWRKAGKERDKEARKAWREAEKDRREAEREWVKDQREAERERVKAEQEARREWEKDRREAEREWVKDRREAEREREKDRREGRREDRDRDDTYDPRY
jgi:hypothetical protein